MKDNGDMHGDCCIPSTFEGDSGFVDFHCAVPCQLCHDDDRNVTFCGYFFELFYHIREKFWEQAAVFAGFVSELDELQVVNDYCCEILVLG